MQHNPIDQIIGANLSRLRTAAGLSGSRLAELANLDVVELARAEAGDRRLSASELFKLCSALDAAIADLFADLGLQLAGARQGPPGR